MSVALDWMCIKNGQCLCKCMRAGEAKWQKTRTFGTFTQDLLLLAGWLKECGVTHVAMEATSVYWRPIWAMLEGQFEQCW